MVFAIRVKMGNNTAEQKVTPRSRDGQNQSPGCTALMYACQQGDVNQVEKLLKINVSVTKDLKCRQNNYSWSFDRRVSVILNKDLAECFIHLLVL